MKCGLGSRLVTPLTAELSLLQEGKGWSNLIGAAKHCNDLIGLCSNKSINFNSFLATIEIMVDYFPPFECPYAKMFITISSDSNIAYVRQLRHPPRHQQPRCFLDTLCNMSSTLFSSGMKSSGILSLNSSCYDTDPVCIIALQRGGV